MPKKPSPKKGKRQPRYNWAEIRQAREVLGKSYADLAEEFGAHERTIRNRAKKDGWRDPREVAAEYATRSFARLDELLEAVEAVTVAAPTLDHHTVGLACLEAGCDVLMEKPIAASLAEARELVSAAESADRVLEVGHVERYNPAVEALIPQIDEPRFIEIHRLGAFAERSLEVDVVVDLMIHDIDIVHSLVDGEVTEIRAVGVPVLSSKIDIANARLELSTGCIVNMTASRVSMTRVRKVRVFQPNSYYSVDYSEQAVAGFRLGIDAKERQSIEGVPVAVNRGEPLRGEIADFLDCVRSRQRPRVDGAAGVRALDTALKIRAAITPAAIL